MSLKQLHEATDAADALVKTNLIVSVYKGYNWTVDVDFDELQSKSVITCTKQDGSIKIDEVTWNV